MVSVSVLVHVVFDCLLISEHANREFLKQSEPFDNYPATNQCFSSANRLLYLSLGIIDVETRRTRDFHYEI